MRAFYRRPIHFSLRILLVLVLLAALMVWLLSFFAAEVQQAF
jgi:hypothetical protein